MLTLQKLWVAEIPNYLYIAKYLSILITYKYPSNHHTYKKKKKNEQQKSTVIKIDSMLQQCVTCNQHQNLWLCDKRYHQKNLSPPSVYETMKVCCWLRKRWQQSEEFGSSQSLVHSKQNKHIHTDMQLAASRSYQRLPTAATQRHSTEKAATRIGNSHR